MNNDICNHFKTGAKVFFFSERQRQSEQGSRLPHESDFRV